MIIAKLPKLETKIITSPPLIRLLKIAIEFWVTDSCLHKLSCFL